MVGIGLFDSMTTLVSDKVHHLQDGGIYPRVNSAWALHFLKKLTYGFLGDIEKGQNLTFKVNFLCQKLRDTF